MTANTMTQATRTMTPCDCAGLGAITASPCTCGGAGCAICQTQFYVRPKFFAGQLLTDDDLQSLDDYVVAKNRLHTRYLFGSGVVCGLAVTCEPCGGGKVIVNPGYALDCCGNDIVVPCPQTLDINVMVRDLLMRMRGGYDCGDPCAGAGKTSSGQSKSGIAQEAGKALNPARRYCLYIDYCEQLSDPVAPYANNDPCGQTTCEPTRVREGFRFELRCPEEDDCIPEICNRLSNCIGEPTAAERTIVDSHFLRPYSSRLGRAAKTIRENPVPKLPDDYWKQLEDHTKQLESALHSFTEPAPAAVTEAKLRLLLDAILAVAGDLARYWIQSEQQQAGDHTRDLSNAAYQLKEACKVVTPDTVDRALTTTLARIHAHALLEVTSRLLQKLSPGTEQAQVNSRTEYSPPEDLPIRVLAERVVFNRDILSAVANSLTALRNWLIVHLECQQPSTHCTLLKKVSAVLPLPPVADISLGSAETVSRSAEILCRAVREVLKDCFCNALNPPCPSCDDAAVLLACLTVEDCEVKEICNLDRDFVITGPAIRYWIPELSRLGESLEKWCCPSCEEECDEAEHDEKKSTFLRAFGPAPPYVELALSIILGACPPIGKVGKPMQSQLLDLISRRLSTGPTTEVAADAAAMNGQIDRAKAELRGENESLRGEINALQSENARLEERLAMIEGDRRQFSNRLDALGQLFAKLSGSDTKAQEA